MSSISEVMHKQDVLSWLGISSHFDTYFFFGKTKHKNKKQYCFNSFFFSNHQKFIMISKAFKSDKRRKYHIDIENTVCKALSKLL